MRKTSLLIAVLLLTTCVPDRADPPAPTGAFAHRFGVAALDGAADELSATGALLAPPSPARSRPRPADESCPALADAGFTARCGMAQSAGGPLVWVVHTRAEGRGLRAQVLRPTAGDGDRLDVVLEVTDESGSRFDDIRATVADITGDGDAEIAVSFYRRGAQQVLALDVVQWPGRVTLHRDYVQGSARATAGKLEGWSAPGGGGLRHETITYGDGAWRRTVASAESAAVYGQDFADPFLLHAGTRYYGYSTNRGASNVPVVTSTDPSGRWYALPDALPRLPSWTSRGRVWAPSVLDRPSGYVLYYTTRELASGLQCISRAWSASPAGPFSDTSTGPLICQTELSGSIDASPFVAPDGRAYLTWKSEGWAAGLPAQLWAQELSGDGMSLVGEPALVLGQDRDWELPTIEGPSMVAEGGELFLFYSAGRWQNSSYAVGWARCSSPLGPCEKDADQPLLRSAGDGTGPGGPGGSEVVADRSGGRWMAYHAWVPFEGGYPAGRRMLHVTPLRFVQGRPVLGTGELAP
ncbi:MAG TPA: glycoside hydrolase family 43 protein [Acidimicrobiales bacterium]